MTCGLDKLVRELSKSDYDFTLVLGEESGINIHKSEDSSCAHYWFIFCEQGRLEHFKFPLERTRIEEANRFFVEQFSAWLNPERGVFIEQLIQKSAFRIVHMYAECQSETRENERLINLPYGIVAARIVSGLMTVFTLGYSRRIQRKSIEDITFFATGWKILEKIASKITRDCEHEVTYLRAHDERELADRVQACSEFMQRLQLQASRSSARLERYAQSQQRVYEVLFGDLILPSVSSLVQQIVDKTGM